MIFRPTALRWPFDLRLLSFPTARPLTAVYWSVLSGRAGIEKRKFNDRCPAANLKISASGHAIDRTLALNFRGAALRSDSGR